MNALMIMNGMCIIITLLPIKSIQYFLHSNGIKSDNKHQMNITMKTPNGLLPHRGWDMFMGVRVSSQAQKPAASAKKPS